MWKVTDRGTSAGYLYKRGKCVFCSSLTAETNCFIHLLQNYRPASHHTSLTHLCNELSLHLWPLPLREKYSAVENVHRLQCVDVINPRDGRLRSCARSLVCCKLARVMGYTDNARWQQLMVSLLALVFDDVKRQVTHTVTASWLKVNLSLVHPVNKRQRGDTTQFIWLTNIDGTHRAPEGVRLSPQLAAPVKIQNLLPDWP